MSEPELILVERGENYAVITINRPEKRNAVSRPLQLRLWEVLDELRDEDIRVIVLTGAGDKSFCSGVDLRDDSPKLRGTALEPNMWLATQQRIAAHPAVFIAAVNGYALGGDALLGRQPHVRLERRPAQLRAVIAQVDA
jgi:enoyl-CoA hydratase/carnithine racemase